MKKNKLFIILAVVIIMSIGVTAFACNVPWSVAYLTVEQTTVGGVSTNRASATLNKCGCNPVDNQLDVGVRIQYKSGTHYYWYPSQTTFVYKVDYDTDLVYKEITHSNIQYAISYYDAYCYTGGTGHKHLQIERHITSWYDNGVLQPAQGFGTSTRFPD